MSHASPLDELQRLLTEATAHLEVLTERDGLARAQRLIEQTPADERSALLNLVRGELEICRMRREHSVWTTGSRMHVNRSARIFARKTSDLDGGDALREATARGTIDSVRTLADRLGPDPEPSGAALSAACARLTPQERAAALAIARDLLSRVEPIADH